MTEPKRYVTQFRAAGDETWDDSVAFDDPARAIEHVLAVVRTKPRLLTGRVYDQVEQKVVEEITLPG